LHDGTLTIDICSHTALLRHQKTVQMVQMMQIKGDMGLEAPGNHRGLPLRNNHLIQNEKLASALRGFACAYAGQTQPSRGWYPRAAPTQLFVVIKRKMGPEGSNLQPSGL